MNPRSVRHLATGLLFLFATSSETEHEGTVTVEFVDAVVTRVTRG